MLTRAEIADLYPFNENGIICSPGKFEGEMCYVPYFWETYLEGWCMHDDGNVLTFKVNPEDRKEFPELKGVRTVKLYERDDGFVCEY